ncbi:MAG: hypothetical protein AAF270_12175 [Pseudomonadota bacterium]
MSSRTAKSNFVSSLIPVAIVGFVATVLVVVWRSSGTPIQHDAIERPAQIAEPTSESSSTLGSAASIEQPEANSTEVTQSSDSLLAGFPDVVVEVREGHSPDTSTPLRLRLEALRRAAESGDADAALELAGSLVECAASPRSPEELEVRINTLYQTRRVPTNAAPIDDLYGAVEDLRDNYEFCEGITLDQVLDHFIYMKLAADNGNLEAKSRLTGYGAMPEDGIFEALDRAWLSREDRARDELKHNFDAAISGDADAILTYGSWASEPMFNVDRTEALAFQLAGIYLKMADGQFVARYEQELMRLRGSTSKNEMDIAIERAKQILTGENCCYRIK